MTFIDHINLISTIGYNSNLEGVTSKTREHYLPNICSAYINKFGGERYYYG